ncbi:Transposon Ty3-G Gag-Pol polyprotein [Labeo rohita]|uniref:ribonuclease H n=1 Tax=Labeo rohita TaxID=84645 RepID=A0ABQ8LMD0_LABRO|nr:Transposon Ty3-G Gag-Pol polyprotein [Labeo rohita]
MAAVSNVIPFGLLYMRPLQWCLKTKGGSPRGNLLCMIKVTRRCLRALDMWRRPWFLSQGPVLGAPCRRVMLATDASLTGWGVATPPTVCGAVTIQLGTSAAWRCWPCFSALGRSACQPCRCSRAQRSPASPYLSLPPGNVAELGSSPPLRGSLQQLVRPSPAGHPLQDTELAAQTTPEASLERLAPLADYLAAWKLLPNVSAWVLRTVERGYRIQFSAPPLPFNGVFPTVVSPEQGLVMEQEVETLLRKEAIEVVPPQDGESGFYSRYFIVPKKDGGLRPILDLRLLNRSVMRLKFKMLTINQVVSQIRKFLRFAFRGEAYQYRVLPFGLALSPRTFTKCVDAALAPLRLWGIRTLNYIDDWLILAQSEHMAVQHRDVVLAHLKELGLRLNAKKKNHLSRQGVGFDHDAGTFVTCSDRVNPHCSHESDRRPVTHRKAVPVTAGSDGSCVQRDTFWPAVHETPTVVAQDQGVLPEGKPIPHDQGHVAMPTCLRHVEEALVPVSGPGVRSSLSPHNASDGCVSHRLGCSHEWPPRPRSVEQSPSHLAHQLPGDAGRVSSVETLSHGPNRPPCVGSHRQHSGGLLLQPPGRSVFVPLIQAGVQILVWSQDKLLSLRAVHVPGHLNMGADILSRQGLRPGEWMLHPEVVKQIWRVFGQAQVDLFATQENAQCPHWFSLTHPAPLGLDAMVQTWQRLRLYAFPLIALLPGVLERVCQDGDRLLLVAPYWPARAWFSDLIPSSTALPGRFPSGGISSRKREAPSFTLARSCGNHQQDPVNCPAGTVLEFLQDRFSAGLAHSTLKVYVAAIAAYHTLQGGPSVGRNPWLQVSSTLCSVIHTRQGLESLAAWAYHSPSVFGRSVSFPRGNHGYIRNLGRFWSNNAGLSILSQATADFHEPSKVTADLMSQVKSQLVFTSQVKTQLFFMSQVKSRQTSLSQVKSQQTFLNQVKKQLRS